MEAEKEYFTAAASSALDSCDGTPDELAVRLDRPLNCQERHQERHREQHQEQQDRRKDQTIHGKAHGRRVYSALSRPTVALAAKERAGQL